MSILEILAYHTWDDNYILSPEARERIVKTRTEAFIERYPRIWYRRATNIDELRNERMAYKFLLKHGTKYRMYYGQIMIYAALHGDMETITYMTTFSISTNGLSVYGAEGGHIEVIKKYCGNSDMKAETCAAARYNHADVAECCITVSNKKANYSDVAVGAAEGGHLDLVKLAIKKGARNYRAMAEAAAKNGHLDIIKHVDGKYKTYYPILIAASRGGHVRVIEYMSTKTTIDDALLRRLTNIAAMNGHGDAFAQYVDKSKWNTIFAGSRNVIQTGTLELFRHFVNSGSIIPCESTLWECVCYGSLDVVKYLCDDFGHLAFDLDKAASIAARNGNLEMLQYLYDCGAAVHINNAVFAARDGYLEIVEFIVEAGATNYREIYRVASGVGHGHVCDYIKSKIDQGLEGTKKATAMRKYK